MQISANQENLLRVPAKQEVPSVQTPIKKNKIGFHSGMKTAETPTLDFSTSKATIADIEADQLFANFNRIVTVSQGQDQFQSQPTYRRLQFQKENNKLDFDQSTNSMKKKRRGSRLIPCYQDEAAFVKPFILNQCSQDQKDEQSLKERADTEEGMSPELKRRTSKTTMMSTPTKKPVRNGDLQLAARKECPFRDLKPRKNLFD